MHELAMTATRASAGSALFRNAAPVRSTRSLSSP
jgi:hypothetical protein